MLSAGGRPALRPRPPSQRRSSQSPQPPDVSTSDSVADDKTVSLPRPPLSDIHNTISSTVDADNAHTIKAGGLLGAPIRSNAQASSSHDSEMLSPSSSASELDHARLERLERHELEELLIEASRKMREREQKLVVAANIGKALLEKNLSLRSGIMTSMASSSSLFGLSDIEAMINDYSEYDPAAYMGTFDDIADGRVCSPPRPIYSPPTTDIDVQSLSDVSPARSCSDTTPIAQPMHLPDGDPDYFNRPASDRLARPAETNTFAAEASSAGAERAMWVPSDAGLIVSQPCSPSISVSSFASHALLSPHGSTSRVSSKRDHTGSRHRSRPSLLQLQALEAQRQLASLGEQNDVLHQQISELQHEAESARFEGSKKLSRLNKEIRGLKAELEAATRRNNELENNHFASRPLPASRSPLRDPLVHGRSNAPSPLLVRAGGRQEAASASFAPSSNSAEKDKPNSDHHGLVPSTSNLEDMVRSAQTTAGESALLVQLLAKIKELEETNSAMAKAEEDFGSRMGRAMQEDERLRDAFNTVGQDLGVDTISNASWTSLDKVLNASNSIPSRSPSRRPPLQGAFITPSHSLRSLDSLASAEISSMASPISPSQKRRAPGNRHVIESRKTVRTALRRAKKELAADIWGLNSDPAPAYSEMSQSSTEQSLGTYSINLSASSSASSSPRAKGMSRRASSNSIELGAAGRPRIRITPSIEDLGRRRNMHEEVIAGPPQESSQAEDWQDVPTPTLSTFPQNASLSPSDAMQAYNARLQVQPRHKSAHYDSSPREPGESTEPPRFGTEARLVLSPFQQKSFKPTARLRRSRSRSSSFSSHLGSGQQAVSLPQSHDSFMSPSPARHRPNLGRSPASASSQHGRTLGSELGSIFGGDDRKHDFDDDLPQHRRSASGTQAVTAILDMQALVLHSSDKMTAIELRSRFKAEVESDRPTANVGRLVPHSEEEHRDDLEYVLTQTLHGQIEEELPDDTPPCPRDAALLARVEAEEQGAWLAEHPIIEWGGLLDEDEPRSAQFDLINAVVEHQAVAWADDDDYGRTISQREATKLGLLAPSPSNLAGRGVRLLSGKSKHASSAFGFGRSSNSTKQKQAESSKDKQAFRLEIETSEQVEHRLRIESLLRRRRQELLREREFIDEWEDDVDEQKQEAELVATYAPTPQRLQEKRMQALVGGRSNEWNASRQRVSPPNRDPRRSTQQWVRDLACVSPTRKSRVADQDHDQDQDLMSLDCVRPEDGEFELLDCPTWKKQGGRGTDYFPTSFRARYRPAMVKQRVAHVSQVTYGWVEEWVQFAFVVFLAFVVMVEQGPNRSMRREGPTAAARQALLNKAE
ncbi:uncharacterized protein SPSC_06665 [Sporisorium scitamineum]|uniref:Uncharacterized protein n=1 Tax=Sporisorium scitamineum TaxID=49012 RepID=A0A0F7SAG3_9BASI|nr:uncharacterized protein SPSC_06665 [Sporisorium scitamineum]CDW97785.1 hypothetical protein [Sporisorium scitamineum]